MRKFLPHLVWLSGLLLFVFGLQYVPDIMPDEVPPEMRGYYHRHLLLPIIGLLVFLSGVIWVVARWFIRHFIDES
jgi:hypothetical protein